MGRCKIKRTGPPRVLVLSQFYWPEPAFYATSVAEDLVDAGANVQVLTGYPNRPGGEIYQGYRQRINFQEEREGVTINRVPLAISHSSKAVERIVSFISFASTATTAIKLARLADVVYVYATPMTAAIPAQIWNLLFGTRYVLHVQDLWPESVTESGMLNSRANRVATAALGPWLRRAYAGAAHVFAISPGMGAKLVERGASSARTSVIFNWADEKNIVGKRPDSREAKGLVLAYAGNLGRMQSLDTLIEAVKVLKDIPNLSLRIAGGGVEEEHLKEISKGIGNIEFIGRIERSEIHELYQESDFQLVTLRDLPIFRVTVPSKLQASLASSVPVITTVQGDVAKLVERYNAGFVAAPEDVASLADAIERAARTTAVERRAMGENARRLYDDLMGSEAGLKEIRDVLFKQACESRESGAG